MSATGVDLAGRLDAGESLESISLSLLSSAHRATLMRCAVPRDFDARTYAEVLAVPGAPKLETLVDREELTRAPRTTGGWRVDDDLRRAALSAWWSEAGLRPLSAPVPDALRAFAGTLAAHLQERDDRLEALHVLLLVDEAAAASLFTTLSEEADRGLDLAAYQNLLDVLAATDRPVVGPSLATLRNGRLTYFTARSMWEAEWHQSARYLHRAGIEAALLDLLEPNGTRMVSLHAPGGMGKTKQLRWFITRVCVPDPHRLPCGLLDFDVVDPVRAMRFPWLALLHLIEQLDRQLPGAPFGELLASYRPFLSMLPRHQRTVTSSIAPASVDGEDVRERIRATLAELPAEAPVLLVLDTLEEALLRPAGDPTALFAALSDLVHAAPCVRVVLSGRYDLRDRLAAFVQRHPDVQHVEIGPFGPDEAVRYLTDVRGLIDLDLVAAIVKQSRGVPFTLALFADYVHLAPQTTAAGIEAFGHPRLMYVIERILERIDDPQVRWLLRYGVVARRLSFDFLVKVVAPWLRLTMSGPSLYDDPASDRRPTDRPVDIWPSGVPVPADEAELRDLWDRLLRFAGTSSWVSPVTDDRDTVSFHETVVEPLRQLLRPHPVLQRLHEDAARFFERQAAGAGADWARLTREALYHRFQARGDSAVDDWRAALAVARDQHGPRVAAEIAGEVLGTEYLDDDRLRMFSDGLPLVSWQTVASARLELAAALTARGIAEDLPGSDETWSEAERMLRRARRAQEDHREVSLPADREAVVAARVLLAQDDAASAAGVVELLEPVREAAAADPAVWAELELAYADALRLLGRPDAAQHYEACFEGASRAGRRAEAVQAAIALSEIRENDGDLTAALRWSELAETHATSAPGLATRAFVLRMSMLTKAARPAEALVELYEVASPVPASTVLALAEAQLAALQPGRAVLACDVGLDLAGRGSEPAGVDLTPRLLLCRGQARARLLEFGPALDDVVNAGYSWRDQGNVAAAARCSIVAADLLLHDVGDLAEAAEHMQELAEPSVLRMLPVEVELAHRLGQADRAHARLAAGRTLLDPTGRRPYDKVSLGMTGLLTGVDVAESVQLVTEGITAVTPPAARLPLLSRLRHFVGPPPPGTSAWPWLAADDEDDGGRLDDDEVVRSLLLADLYRVAGQGLLALGALDRARRLGGGRPAVTWELLLAADRLPHAVRRDVPVPEGAELPVDGLLRGASLLLIADRLLGRGDMPAARERLRAGERLVEVGSTRVNQWQARAAEVRGRLARAEHEEDEARKAAAAAAEVYAKLGDEPRRREALARVLAAHRIGGAPPPAHRDYLTLRLHDDAGVPGHVTTTLIPPDRDEGVPRIVPAAELGLEPERGSRAVRVAVARVGRSVEEWATEAGRLLLPDWPPRLVPPVDVRLALEYPMSAALPWEILRVPGSDLPLTRQPGVALVHRLVQRGSAGPVRHLQQALNALGPKAPRVDLDGVDGPRTAEAVRSFQRRAGLEVDGFAGRRTWEALRSALRGRREYALVLVLQPPRSVQVQSQRGYDSVGTDVADAYRVFGAVANVIEVSPAVAFERQLAEMLPFQADVVHITAPMRQSGTTPVLDFGSDPPFSTGKDEPVTLPVTLLSDLLGRLAVGRRPPAVVLDVPAPHSTSELIRSLLLRNDYASRLVALGNAESVLATGLFSPWDVESSAELARAAAGGDTHDDIARALHSRADPEAPSTDTLGLLGTALISALPPYQLLPPGAV